MLRTLPGEIQGGGLNMETMQEREFTKRLCWSEIEGHGVRLISQQMSEQGTRVCVAEKY